MSFAVQHQRMSLQREPMLFAGRFVRVCLQLVLACVIVLTAGVADSFGSIVGPSPDGSLPGCPNASWLTSPWLESGDDQSADELDALLSGGQGKSGGMPTAPQEASDADIAKEEARHAWLLSQTEELAAHYPVAGSGGSSSAPASPVGASSGMSVSMLAPSMIVLPEHDVLAAYSAERSLCLPSPPGTELLRPPRA